MKTFLTITTLTVALFGFAACDSKVESSRKDALESKADALENKAETVRKDAKTDASDLEKQAALDANAALGGQRPQPMPAQGRGGGRDQRGMVGGRAHALGTTFIASEP